MTKASISQFPELAGYRFQLYLENTEGRAKVEKIVQDTYRKAFTADVQEFMPYLLALEKNDKVCAVVGLRPGGNEPMLLESYLDKTLQDKICEGDGGRVARHDVIEIGSLISVEKGACLILFVLLTSLLSMVGYRWMAFTATGKLQKMVRRFGVNPLLLANAEQSAVSDGQWGTYYETKPQVLASEISEMMKIRNKIPAIDALVTSHEVMLVDAVGQMTAPQEQNIRAA